MTWGDHMIEVRDLTKRYGPTVAVDALSFDLRPGVVTGFLYGVGRPGLNSLAMGIGLVFTVALDALLIPSMGATGAAIASAVAYTATTVSLIVFFSGVNRKRTSSVGLASVAAAPTAQP